MMYIRIDKKNRCIVNNLKSSTWFDRKWWKESDKKIEIKIFFFLAWLQQEKRIKKKVGWKYDSKKFSVQIW